MTHSRIARRRERSSRWGQICCAVLVSLAAAEGRADDALRPVTVVDAEIPQPLTDLPGDAARGRALVADRTRGLCLLCHALSHPAGSFPGERFPGDLGPDLSGIGERLSAGALRLRLVDGRALNPDTIMPSYYSLRNTTRIGAAWRDRPVLDAQEIEDIVAFLATLRDTRTEGTTP